MRHCILTIILLVGVLASAKAQDHRVEALPGFLRAGTSGIWLQERFFDPRNGYDTPL